MGTGEIGQDSEAALSRVEEDKKNVHVSVTVLHLLMVVSIACCLVKLINEARKKMMLQLVMMLLVQVPLMFLCVTFRL